ncbi:MAG: Smr/MutS family protein [Hyphomonas sp.]|nr:Smr/MutS family protein [Hyphomonas sp.]MCB9970890.1 Smr/MutS family protein [Hyphomonas sp.]
MTRHRRLTPEEARAWARVARTVKPIGPEAEDLSEFIEALEHGEPVTRRAPAKPAAGDSAPPKPSALKLPAAPQNRSNERQVRRGKLELAARFDLHGHTQTSASQALPDFLARKQAEGARCVLVITGKGKGGEGVLRRNFLHWLEMPAARTLVSGYSEAHPRHGGSGAWYVFLRSST